MDSNSVSSSNNPVGVVVIGRNEGDRLKRSLQSIDPLSHAVVYVDSGSTDESVSFARGVGCDVIELDLSVPFTAARARNEGYRRLTEKPHIQFIQFIDGDCELDSDWIETARSVLAADPRLAVVCGRRREKFPHASVYNLLTDLEWDTPVGEANSCGGDALMRVSALEEVGGYDESFAAGEEPEMCYRMRQRSWKILRIAQEMTLHDAALTSVKQWWTRSKRSGSAYAHTAWVHGRGPERFRVRDCARIWFWGGLLPAGALLSAPATSGWSLVGAGGAYAVVFAKMTKYRLSVGDSHRVALTFSAFNIAGKLPQLVGQLSFLRHRQSRLIEYKG